MTPDMASGMLGTNEVPCHKLVPLSLHSLACISIIALSRCIVKARDVSGSMAHTCVCSYRYCFAYFCLLTLSRAVQQPGICKDCPVQVTHVVFCK